MSIASPLKWHGGKHYLAEKIVAMMPPHVHYVEPFAGGLSVLLAKDPEGVSEVVNDLNWRLFGFWMVLADELAFPAFQRIVEAMPFSELLYQTAVSDKLEESIRQGDFSDIDVVKAAYFFVHCRQSLAGRMKGFAALSRNRTRRGMNEQASAWLTAIEGLPEVHARLKRVIVLNRPALDVIRQQDGSKTLFYLDPPYLHETRATTGEYQHEMSGWSHARLLVTLSRLEGRFLLSGYPSQLYNLAAKKYGWHRTDFELPNNSAGGATKRRMTECVWTNFVPEAT